MGGGPVGSALLALAAATGAWHTGRTYESWAVVPAADQPVCQCHCLSNGAECQSSTTSSTTAAASVAPRPTLGDLAWSFGGWAIAVLEALAGVSLGAAWVLSRCCPSRASPKGAAGKRSVAAPPTNTKAARQSRADTPLAHLAVDATEL